LPFSMAELKNEKKPVKIDKFLERGGFPEPFLSEDAVDADRWRSQYVDGLIRTDILDFEKIHDFKAIKLVFELLRRKVGSPVSYKSIAEDAEISPITAKKYIEIFEALYIIFRVTPYSKNIARSILKEPKIYFYDNGLVLGDDGAKFENFAAVSLIKNLSAKNDYSGQDEKLRYLRTKEGKETDFAIVDSENKLKEIIEIKLSDSQPDKNLQYFSNKYDFSAIQIVKNLKQERTIGKIRIVRAENYFKELFL